MSKNHIPEGYTAVIPYLIINDLEKEIEFLKNVFGATMHEEIKAEDGKLRHAEIYIDDSIIMMGRMENTVPSMMYVYVKSCDETYQKALEYGAESRQEPQDQFYGDRSAGFKSPTGIEWWLGERKEELSTEEIQERANSQAQA